MVVKGAYNTIRKAAIYTTATLIMSMSSCSVLNVGYTLQIDSERRERLRDEETGEILPLIAPSITFKTKEERELYQSERDQRREARQESNTLDLSPIYQSQNYLDTITMAKPEAHLDRKELSDKVLNQ